MKIIIFGAGRMGMRHAMGLNKSKLISNITIVDNKNDALKIAKEQLKSSKYSFLLFDNLNEIKNNFNISIIATTANDRLKLIKLSNSFGCKHILIEKPIEQSFQKVLEINKFILKYKLNVIVNLNMRLNKSLLKIKNNISKLEQFEGESKVTINTGSIGISANGIHYLDFLIFLFDANNYKIIDAEIYDELIPSGRGIQFKDFGGWILIKLFKKEQLVCTAYISINSKSTVFGSWEIVGKHARISFNEVDQIITSSTRKTKSKAPINHYNKDYLKTRSLKLSSPFLGEFTKIWFDSVIKNINCLPHVSETITAHKIMFDWLSYSKKYNINFPIT